MIRLGVCRGCQSRIFLCGVLPGLAPESLPPPERNQLVLVLRENDDSDFLTQNRLKPQRETLWDCPRLALARLRLGARTSAPSPSRPAGTPGAPGTWRARPARPARPVRPGTQRDVEDAKATPGKHTQKKNKRQAHTEHTLRAAKNKARAGKVLFFWRGEGVCDICRMPSAPAGGSLHRKLIPRRRRRLVRPAKKGERCHPLEGALLTFWIEKEAKTRNCDLLGPGLPLD